MSQAIPPSCQIALKEWASVITALARGEQLVLIRKGGLIEPSRGFELVSSHFLLYPTYEHQTTQFLRQTARPLMDEAIRQRPPADRVRLQMGAVVVDAVQTDDPSIVDKLAAVHVYNDAFLQQRLTWQPQQPLVVAVVRAFALPRPMELPMADRYGGCKSWVELEQAIDLQGAGWVLDDRAFAQRLAPIEPFLAHAARVPH